MMQLKVISVFNSINHLFTLLSSTQQKFASFKLHVFFSKTNIIHTFFSLYLYLELDFNHSEEVSGSSQTRSEARLSLHLFMLKSALT